MSNEFVYAFNLNVEVVSEITKKIIVIGDLNKDILNANRNKLRNVMLVNIISVPTG